MTKKRVFPVLPLRDIVVFPCMIAPLFVGRTKSVNALTKVLNEDAQILLLTQKSPDSNDLDADSMYSFGTIGKVLQMITMPDATVKVLVEGIDRASVTKFNTTGDYLSANVEILKPKITLGSATIKGLVRTAISQFENYAKLNDKLSSDVVSAITKINDPSKLIDVLAAHINISITEKQKILETIDIQKRFDIICKKMESEIAALQTEKRIRTNVKRQLEKNQRDYYLNEQLKAIQKELGETDDQRSEIENIADKLKKKNLSKEAREKTDAEVKKLRMMSPMSAEAAVVRNYLDWFIELPWDQPSKIKKDILQAKKVLDQDHYGLEKVKERILEYLAVGQRVGKVKGPIICLVGPPGVGKTSLGKSIATATGRHFVRVALGGVRDESEVRGHRRTYIGAMPGKVVQGMKKAKSTNPLFLLDEIDKMSNDWRGDPSSAMLEVLDPEQNQSFGDHYLEVDYDLSDVMFIATANSLADIPHPLMDRMEIIQLSGYTENEKLEICKRHLLVKQLKLNGLKKSEFSITDDTIKELIRRYTREAGVRDLERYISKLMRKVVHEIITKKATAVKLTKRNLGKYAGIPRFSHSMAENEDYIGVTTGLAWTQFGGDLLAIEAIRVPGKGQMKITGKLGDVMQESVQAAASYIKANATNFGVVPTIFEKSNFHIHVPEGATPKDGPSAGIAMCTSIISALTKTPVRKDVAMTGEVTLRGRVLAIGGLKEKLLAALRGEIKKVLIPHENVKDLEEIPDNVKKGLEIVAVKHVSEVFQHALSKKLKPIIWNEEMEKGIVKDDEDLNEDVMTH